MNSAALEPAVLIERTAAQLRAALDRRRVALEVEELGTVEQVGPQIALVRGLPGAGADELLAFEGERLGFACNLDPDRLGVVLLDASAGIRAGSRVRRTGRVIDVPVGEALLGRVVDPLGRPLDRAGPLAAAERLEVERPAPPLMARAPVAVPLQTGLKVIDALIPIGRGQRELILGDRQTGKTAIAVDAILNQRGTGVRCVYCAVGQQSASVARVIDQLRRRGALEYTIVVVAGGDDAAGLQFIAPYAAASMAEYFRDRGGDALVVFDDLTRHARAYRELSLLLRRPPGREAFPGDVFYIHSRLLERATRLRRAFGGGSLTALPICETEAQDISSYISTNLISITDGQVFLTPTLLHKGILPAVDVGRSVSRVGGKAQPPAYRSVAGDLRLAYAQFEELEAFSRFGTRLDAPTRAALERGRRVREVLRQPELAPLPVSEQVAVLLALNSGLFDPLPVEAVAGAEDALRRAAAQRCAAACARIEAGEPLADDDRAALLAAARAALAGFEGGAHAGP